MPDSTRLGSTTTGAGGDFELRYPYTDGRPWLVLVVRSPADGDGDGTVFYRSQPRRDAAASEHFLISVDPAALNGHGTIGAGGATAVIADVRAGQVAAAAEGHGLLRAKARNVIATELSERALVTQRAKAATARLVTSLSKVPEGARDQEGFVAPGTSIVQAQRRVTEKRIGSLPSVRQRLSIALTPEQLEDLEAEHPNGDIPLPDLITPLAGPGGIGVLDVVAEHPAAIACRDEILAGHPCLEVLDSTPEQPEQPEPRDEPQPGEDTTGDEEGIKARVGDLVAAISLPEEALTIHVPDRPDIEAVADGAKALRISGGPSDVTAFHDFHTLQIAFDHVWTEVFDDGVVRAAELLYKMAIASGSNVDQPAPIDPELAASSSAAPLDELRDGIDDLLTVYREAPALQYAAAPGRPIGGHGQMGIAFMRKRPDWGEGGPDPGIDYDPPGGGQPPEYRPPGGTTTDDGTGDEPSESDDPAEQVRTLLQKLEELLAQEYAFTVFAADGRERAVNFGLVTTWRQQWDPLAYQTGEVVRTVPLMPGEQRKITTTRKISRKRAEKEVNKSIQSYTDESSDTTRAETDILAKAESKTNFSLSASGSINVGIGSAKTTAGFGRDVAKVSQETRKDFREAVLKATQEVRNERTVEVSTDETFEFEDTTSTTLKNPNNELSMTCVFFELQRRYRISETLHRLTPVVLVAQEVPEPNGIDAAFLIRYSWIIDRVLLDDSFRPALRYLSTSYIGDKNSLAHLKTAMETQQTLVETLRQELEPLDALVSNRYKALQTLIKKRSAIVRGADGGILDAIGDVVPGMELAQDVMGFFGFGGGDDDNEDDIKAARILEDAAHDALERAERKQRDMQLRIGRANSALQEATNAFVAAFSANLNHRVQIARLRLHVKQNLLFYMQAIWSHEPPDQRYFRLHQTPVPRLDGTVVARSAQNGGAPRRAPRWDLTPTEFEAEFTPVNGGEIAFDPLAEVADLDNLLGFKGNYMIFPLRVPNKLVEYMMLPYIDAHTILRDPDDFAGWTLPRFGEYVCCLRRKVDAGELPEETFDSFKPGLREVLEQLLTQPRPAEDEIVVPSGSLYLEVLPGAHPLLEDFKLAHRALDVKKVQAETRAAELENLRIAARILVDELADPDIDDIDKRLVVGASVVNP